MNPIQSFSSQDMMHTVRSGAPDPSGSVMEFMIEVQRLVSKEGREDRKLLRQTQAQELQRETQAHELEQQAQAQHGHGFFQGIANFLTGGDGGGSNVAGPEKLEQSSLAWGDWKKFLKLH